MKKVGAVQHEAAFGLDRSAAHDLHDAGARRQLDHVGCRNHVELHQQIGKIDVRRRMVDDDAHGALGGMRADIDQRTRRSARPASPAWRSASGRPDNRAPIFPDVPRGNFITRKVSRSIRICKRTARASKVHDMASIDFRSRRQMAGSQCHVAAVPWQFADTVTIMSVAACARFALDSGHARCPRIPSINDCDNAADLPRRHAGGAGAGCLGWDKQPHAAGAPHRRFDDRRPPTRHFLRAGVEIRLDPAGRPIGASPAIPACRRRWIFPAPRTSSR
jgi:hypothetical protein